MQRRLFDARCSLLLDLNSLSPNFRQSRLFFGKTPLRPYCFPLGKESLFLFQPPCSDFREKPLHIFGGNIEALGDIGNGGAVGEAGRFDALLLPQGDDGAGFVGRHPLGAGREGLCRVEVLGHRAILAYLASEIRHYSAAAGTGTVTSGYRKALSVEGTAAPGRPPSNVPPGPAL